MEGFSCENYQRQVHWAEGLATEIRPSADPRQAADMGGRAFGQNPVLRGRRNEDWHRKKDQDENRGEDLDWDRTNEDPAGPDRWAFVQIPGQEAQPVGACARREHYRRGGQEGPGEVVPGGVAAGDPAWEDRLAGAPEAREVTSCGRCGCLVSIRDRPEKAVWGGSAAEAPAGVVVLRDACPRRCSPLTSVSPTSPCPTGLFPSAFRVPLPAALPPSLRPLAS